MDVTADTLVNQVASIVLAKLDKQNFDPNFLQKFMDSLLGKLSLGSGSSKTKKTSSRSTTSTASGLTIIDDIKKAYKELLKDAAYKNEYKKFLKDVLPKGFFENNKDALKGLTPSQADTKTDKQAATPKTTDTFKPQPQTSEGRVKLIDKPVEQQKVIFDGFSEKGWGYFSERLPKILKPLFPKPTDGEKPKTGGGLGLLGGGLALLLGGLAALVAGLMTDGPFKGILKILSKVGIQGGIKLLQVAAKVFIGGLKQVIMAPINLLKGAAKTIGKIFGKGAFKAIMKPLRGMTNLFAKMAGGLFKFLKPLLKRIPLIGTVISWGFAYSRFKSGDVVGGIIDILSGIASIFPGVGTAIAIGLDVLNAFLDTKAGGADGKASKKKTTILKEWALGLGKLLYDGIKYIPVIGPLIQAVEDMVNGKWLDATYNLVRAIPGVGIVIDILNWFTEGKTETGIKEGLSNAGKSIGEWLNWLKENIWDKITGFVTGIFDGVKSWWNNLSWDPRSWVGMAPEEPEPPKQQPTSKVTTETSPPEQQLPKVTETATPPVPLAEGGIITEPTKAIVGEAGPEAVIPLDADTQIMNFMKSKLPTFLGGTPEVETADASSKVLAPEQPIINNEALDKIVANTGDTNTSLKMLSEAIFKLAAVFDKKTTSNNTPIVVNSAGKQQEDSTSASQAAASNQDPIRRVRMQFAY